MKIIIMELLYHHECLGYPHKYFVEKGCDVKVILGEYVFDKLDQDFKVDYILPQKFRKKWLSKGGISKLVYFFKEFNEIYKNIQLIKHILKNEKPDYLYINTIDNPFLIPLWFYLLFDLTTKKIYVVHRTDLKYGENRSIIKTFLNQIIYTLFKKAHALVFLAEYLDIPYIHSKKLYFNNRTIEKNNEKKYDDITFVIPGVMNLKERDYKTIFATFKELLDKKLVLETEIRIKLLTKNTKDLEDIMNNYGLMNVVDTYDLYVPEELYKKIMKKSHLCILPTYKNSNYGKYKISGAWGDAIAFGIPILIPDWYAENHNFGENVIRYNETNIAEKIIEFIKNSKFHNK